MEIKAEKQHMARSACAIVLTAAIALGSFFTASAAQSELDREQNSVNSAAQENKIEFELVNGDMVVGKSVNLDMQLNVIKANEVKIENGNEVKTVMLAKGTVGEVLERANITLNDDQVSVPSVNSEIKGDITVKILNAQEVKVTADGETKTVLAPSGNVVKSLNSLGYNIGKNDILSVSKDSDIIKGLKVKIKRVTYAEETVTESVPFGYVSKNSNKVNLGQRKIGTYGKKGEKLVTRKCKYVDGKKVASKVIDAMIIKEAVDQVELIGTKSTAPSSGAAGSFTDMYGNQVGYSRVLTGSGTAYTAPPGALTASGVPAYYGGVAVNPSIIPLGSKLYITSTDGSVVYGYATAVDTGGALFAGTALVDLYYNTYGECVNFGRRNVNVYVL